MDNGIKEEKLPGLLPRTRYLNACARVKSPFRNSGRANYRDSISFAAEIWGEGVEKQNEKKKKKNEEAYFAQ